MTRPLIISFAFVSLFFFPFSFWMMAALAAAVSAPLAPFAIGIFADLLYYAPHASVVPLYTCGGAVLALVSFALRKFIETNIISS
ncbi:MAG TPA: hypothetical protein VM103_00405 [Candidatus Paceibacterota bacterium]|nr:hypothetical protein [Candidatus Paceibacterota bacterium]